MGQSLLVNLCAFITSAWQGFKRDVSAHVVVPVKVKIVYRPKGPELPIYCTQVWPYTLSTRAIMCGEPLGRGVTGAVGLVAHATRITLSKHAMLAFLLCL